MSSHEDGALTSHIQTKHIFTLQITVLSIVNEGQQEISKKER